MFLKSEQWRASPRRATESVRKYLNPRPALAVASVVAAPLEIRTVTGSDAAATHCEVRYQRPVRQKVIEYIQAIGQGVDAPFRAGPFRRQVITNRFNPPVFCHVVSKAQSKHRGGFQMLNTVKGVTADKRRKGKRSRSFAGDNGSRRDTQGSDASASIQRISSSYTLLFAKYFPFNAPANNIHDLLLLIHFNCFILITGLEKSRR